IIRLNGPGLGNTVINGNTITTFPYNDDFYTITINGNAAVFDSGPLGLRVVAKSVYKTKPNFTPGYINVHVKLHRKWMNQVDGLCKNYDGDDENDCSDSAGNSLIGQPNKGWKIGQGYKIFDPEDPRCDDGGFQEDDPDTCDQRTKATATSYCNGLMNPNGPFANCIQPMSRDEITTWIRDCIMDFCVDPATKCAIAEAFATSCMDSGIPIGFWRTECPLQCGENEHYLPNGPGCEQHCPEFGQTWCEAPPTEGCFCKQGYVRCKQKCIRPKIDYCPETSDSRYGGDPPRACCVNSIWYWPSSWNTYISQPMPQGEPTYGACPEGETFKVYGYKSCGCSPKTECQWRRWSEWSNWECDECPPSPKCGSGLDVKVTCRRSRTRQQDQATCSPPLKIENEHAKRTMQCSYTISP
ncbi:unnamed protein product, partial [Owenia fusiformis]